ncbi:MAG: hypothetical protein IJ600_04965 [Lachnospiraceae bacterium]|nr:hypothetical protein [Lachnospiraceae bacterium]
MKEARLLKEYIWKNGFEKLSNDPYAVYEMLLENRCEAKNSRMIMVTLMSGIHKLAKKGEDTSLIVDHIQAEHDIKKATAQKLADMYLEVFSAANQNDWKKAENKGFKEFCQGVWTVEWEGGCDWHTKHGGCYPCSAKVTLVFSIRDVSMLRKHLKTELNQNPFLSSDEIRGILFKQIGEDLDRDLEEYCNADDYYEPYLEEFTGDGTYESEKKWKSWGLEIESINGSGDIDFVP